MASNVLPQALVAIPSNYSIQCPPFNKHLGFPADTNRRLSLSNFKATNSMLISRASSNLLSSNFSSIFSIPAKKTFPVRSEPESAEPSETEADTDAVEGDIEAPIVEDGDDNSELEAEIVAESEAEVRPPRQPRVKMGDIMGLLNKRAVEASEEMRPVPDIRVGDVVQIKLEVPENRRRLSVYKGIVISRQNAGIHTTFRTRRIIAVVGVEIVFPLYSPNIKEIKVVDHRKVRKAKLFYLRDKLPRLSSFK